MDIQRKLSLDSRRRPATPTPTSPRPSISHPTNTGVFRSTFIGASVPALRDAQACSACDALYHHGRSNSEPNFKRHAVILPTRHQGRACRLTLSLGDNNLTAWEREGLSPSSSVENSPATTPSREPNSPGLGSYALFSSSAQNVSRFSVESVATMWPASPMSGTFNFPTISEEVESRDDAYVKSATQQFLRLL